MDSKFERDWKFHEEMSWLKDPALANMKEALVTDWTFQLSNGWLKEVEFKNVRSMLAAIKGVWTKLIWSYRFRIRLTSVKTIVSYIVYQTKQQSQCGRLQAA
jgi:hypothetical protein